METKQVIVMRKDLNMRKGKMIAQGSHASMACLTRLMYPIEDGTTIKIEGYDELTQWLGNSYAKICVSVDSENELLNVYQNAKNAELNVQLIEDSGRTEFGGITTKTCLCIGPHEVSKIDEITKHLKLL